MNRTNNQKQNNNKKQANNQTTAKHPNHKKYSSTPVLYPWLAKHLHLMKVSWHDFVFPWQLSEFCCVACSWQANIIVTTHRTHTLFVFIYCFFVFVCFVFLCESIALRCVASIWFGPFGFLGCWLVYLLVCVCFELLGLAARHAETRAPGHHTQRFT